MGDHISLNAQNTQSHEQERADAAANRVLLLETARRLFFDEGVAAVTMAEIASEAGVGKGTLYRRFSNKGELCFALLDADLQRFQNEVLLRLRQMNSERMPYLNQLAHFLDDLVHFTADNQALLCEVARSGAAPSEDIELPHFWQQLTIRGLLQQAKDSGEVAADLDISCTAALLVAPLHATVLRTYRDGLGFSLEQISASLANLVVGLRS